MDEDDEFGDLYADLGGGKEPEAPVDAGAPGGSGSGSAKIGYAVDEEDDADDELYAGGFGKTDGKRGDEGSARAEASFSNGSVKEKPPSRVEDSEEGGSGRFQENGGEGSESDSDDDLQIVLNNDKPAPSEPEPATGESNEETEDVPAANQPWTEEQQPAQLEVPPPQPQMGVPAGVLPPGLLPSDQSSKPNAPNANALPRPPGKPFIQQHHAQYKYVRGPMLGGPMNSTPVVVQGLGRGYPGAWGPGKGPPPIGIGQQRPWSGPPGFPHSDIHLPPTKTVFDMDLDALEDKPWRHANIDVTDYFNFGFTENSWKQYCQQLSQLRLEATMQSKISVYESGRSEQPIGRAIQVEGGVGERRPSYDVRRNRNRDSNDVIEIVLQDAVEETPIPIADRMEMNDGNDYEGTMHDQDVGEPSSRGGPLLGRNGPFMEDGPPFFPMGPRPRGPYRMFPGGPFGPGRGGVMRPPFYEPGMPPLPMHMRPDGYPLGDFGEPPRRGTSGSMGQSRNPSQGRMALEEEHSSGSVAVKDDRKHADSSKDYKDERRSKSNRDHGKEEEDEKSDEHKRSSDDKYDQGKRQKRYPESRPQKDGRKKEPASDIERSSYSGEEDPKSRHRSREGDHEHSWQKKPPASDEKDRRQEKEKDLRKEEEWARRSHREREEARWKEEDLRRASRNRDDDISRRREEDGRKRDKVEEHWQRKEREESWRRDRDDPQKRRSGYEDSYERKEREDERSGHSDRSKRHGYDKAPADSRDEEEYLRRKSKHDSQRKDYRDARQYEDDHYDHRKSGTERSSSRGGREQEDERLYKDKYGWASRSKDADSRRNGSTSEHLDDRLDRKKRKSEYQKSGGHAEKVQHEEEATTAASSEKKNSKSTSRIETYHNRTEDSYSSDGDEDGNRRKGRSKMERLNRERPLTSNEEVNPGRYSSSSSKRQDKAVPSAQEKHTANTKGATENSSKTVNGNNKQEPDSFAKRRERFMQAQKVEPSERKPIEKVTPQADTEFKHERPARKRRWGS